MFAARSVATLAQFKACVCLVLGVQQVLSKVADVVVGFWFQANQLNVTRDLLVVEFDSQHGGDVDANRSRSDLITTDFLDLSQMRFGIRHAVTGVTFDHHIRGEAMQSVVHFGTEASHDAVDDNQRGDTQGHTDDRSQRDISRAQIAKTKQPTIHSHSLAERNSLP